MLKIKSAMMEESFDLIALAGISCDHICAGIGTCCPPKLFVLICKNIKESYLISLRLRE